MCDTQTQHSSIYLCIFCITLNLCVCALIRKVFHSPSNLVQVSGALQYLLAFRVGQYILYKPLSLKF